MTEKEYRLVNAVAEGVKGLLLEVMKSGARHIKFKAEIRSEELPTYTLTIDGDE